MPSHSHKFELYNLKSHPEGFRITKFDSDLNPISSYIVSDSGCDCPAGHKPFCRHREMIPRILSIVNTPWFYCYDTGEFTNPWRRRDGMVG